jgi:DNA-binding MarR family transcriptional regulator
VSVVDELIEIVRAFGAFERESVCCGTVTVAQCLVLQALLPGERDVTGLADYAGGSPSAMTRLVTTLEAKEWIARRRDDDDRRRVWVTLTEAGRREAERLRGLTAQALEEILQRIPTDKRAQVVESIALLRVAMATATREGFVCCA